VEFWELTGNPIYLQLGVVVYPRPVITAKHRLELKGAIGGRSRGRRGTINLPSWKGGSINNVKSTQLQLFCSLFHWKSGRLSMGLDHEKPSEDKLVFHLQAQKEAKIVATNLKHRSKAYFAPLPACMGICLYVCKLFQIPYPKDSFVIK
jgi:hypothetical protein